MNVADQATQLVTRIGYTFDDRSLLDLALTHRSWCAENGGLPSNERLEFLGDAILGAAITTHLFGAYPDLSEGHLSKLRAAVVSEPTLADVARDLDLGSCVRLSRGEDAMGGRDKASILSDALEALIGAVYLDGGWPAAWELLERLFHDHIDNIAYGRDADPDYKGRLQELAARHFRSPPSYAVSETGPDHAKEFRATVHIDGEPVGEGTGGSKKKAEQAAAERAWGDLIGHLDAEAERRAKSKTAASRTAGTEPTDGEPDNEVDDPLAEATSAG